MKHALFALVALGVSGLAQAQTPPAAPMPPTAPMQSPMQSAPGSQPVGTIMEQGTMPSQTIPGQTMPNQSMPAEGMSGQTSAPEGTMAGAGGPDQSYPRCSRTVKDRCMQAQPRG